MAYYSSYERNASQPIDAIHAHHYGRPSMDLPRPFEPRPTLLTSLSDTAGTPRRPDAFRSPVLADNRSQYQNLPGLKEILPEGHPASGSAPHTPWPAHGRGSTYFQNNDGAYPGYALHPPMALYPPHVQNAPYQPQSSRAFEIPVLETSRVAKHSSQPIQHPGYADSARDFGDPQPEPSSQAPASTYMSNGVHSPYAPYNSEERHYSASSTAFERPAGSPFGPTTSNESSKQYLGTKEIPGEGTFHFYEGGFRIPTHVDGEQVNPAWGLTKANKPRKRLALACLDCREKKIRCEPGANSCLQCEKAKRTCRRAPAQTSQSNTGSSPTWQDTTSSPVRKNPSTSDPTPTSDRNLEADPLNKRRTRADPSPPNVPSKKHRSASPVTLVGEPAKMAPGMAPGDPSQLPSTNLSDPLESVGRGPLAWEDDPFQLEPEITLHLIELYFLHVNNGVYWLYPRQHFLHWMRTTTSMKCQNERMVLYAMLAAASIFAPSSLSGFGKECARIAGDAIASQVGKFNISVAHTKMLLALFHFAKGSMDIPWDYLGSAINTVTYLRYHTEEGCLDDSVSRKQDRIEFNFSMEQLAECKRRTFWACFLMDKLSSPTTCSLKPEDIFLRLPCMEDKYENSAPSDAPYFPNENIDSALALLTPSSPLAPMAWLALIAGIWGDVIDFVFRASYRPAATYRTLYEPFYTDIRNRMQGWLTRLPPYLQYSEDNLAQSIQQGYAGAFISLHTLYHMAQMKLNQCLRHAEMPDVVVRNIREAHAHAQKQLRMMGALRAAKREIVVDGQTVEYAFSTPYPGYATLTAIDIVGAGGPESTLQPTLELIEGGLFCLRELAGFWNRAGEQLRACEKRFYQVKGVLTSGQTSKSGAWLGRRWGLELPLEQDLKDENNCIYGLGEFGTYFDAFAEDGEVRRGQGRALRIA